MSHVSTIQCEIKSLDALKAACENLGFTFKENQKHYKWFGSWVGDYPMPEGFSAEELGHCEHAIAVPGANYEIGVVKAKTHPGYQLMYDFWVSGGLEPKVGKDGWKMTQEYVIEQTKEVAIKNHKRYEVEELSDRKRIVVYQ